MAEFLERTVRLPDLLRDAADEVVETLRSDNVYLVWSELPGARLASLLVVAPRQKEFTVPIWVGQAYLDWRAIAEDDRSTRKAFWRDIKTAGSSSRELWCGVLGYRDESTSSGPGVLDERIAQAFVVPMAAKDVLRRAVLANQSLLLETLRPSLSRDDLSSPMRDLSWGTFESSLIQSPKANVALLLPRDQGIDSRIDHPIARDAISELHESHSALSEALSELRRLEIRAELFGISGATISWPLPMLFGRLADKAREVILLRANFIRASGLPHFFSQVTLFLPGNNQSYQSGQPFEVLKAIELADSLLGSHTPRPTTSLSEYVEEMKGQFPVFGSDPFHNILPNGPVWSKADEAFLVHA